jgi:hypothetical protein
MNYMGLLLFLVDNMWVAIHNKFNKVVTNGDIMSMELGCNVLKF